MKDGLSDPYRNHKDRHGMGGSEIPNLGVTVRILSGSPTFTTIFWA